MIVIRGLNMFPTMVAKVLTGFEELTGDYRIVLDTKPPYDFLPVHVERAKNQVDDPGLADRVALAIKANLGASARVWVKPAGSFPLTEGKTRRVVRVCE